MIVALFGKGREQLPAIRDLMIELAEATLEGIDEETAQTLM